MKTRAAAVEEIVPRTRDLYEIRTPFRIYHGSTNSTRRSQRKFDNVVDTSKLNSVFGVDEVRKTATVEANVSMESLVEETFKHGLVPLVVMEFPGITVGGGFSGTCKSSTILLTMLNMLTLITGESSSFRHGLFDSTINEIEIILANGDVMIASKTERQDLFWVPP